MENLNKISKSVLFLMIVAFAVFTGSYLTKLLLISQFFDAETMGLKSIYANQNLKFTLESLLPVFFVTLIFYISFLLCFILFLALSKINLKTNGWLFIVAITLLVTTPFEVYLIFKYDIKVISQLFSESFEQSYLIDLLKNRIIELGPFPLILLFSNILIIFLVTFKPLQKRT